MSNLNITTTREVIKVQINEALSYIDEIVTEYPLTLMVNDEEFATVVCTPDHLEELVIGFLASEGAISSYDEIKDILIDTNKGIAYIDLVKTLQVDQQFFSKRRITSCCGKSRQSFYFFSDAKNAKVSHTETIVSSDQVVQLMKDLQSASQIHQQTGGVHNAALCTPTEVLVQFSDIGRHNALDKIYGYCLKHGISTEDKVLVFSGRISSEVLLKSAKIGAGILLSKSAPTELALQMADELGITAVGFIRNQTMNIYTHHHRILVG